MSAALALHVLELFAPLGAVGAKRMFGGHGFTIDGVFIALIANQRLYLKTDAQTESQFKAVGATPFTFTRQGKAVATSYWAAPPEALESAAAMAPWAQRAVDAALRARAVSKPRKAAQPRPSPAARPKPAAQRATAPTPSRRAPAKRR